MSIRLIRCNNSDPVTPYDDAVVFHSAKGHDYTGDKRGGVFNKVYDGMGYIRDNVNHKFIVKSGMAMLYGRQFEIPQNETIEFEVASLAGKYCVVYIEVKNEFIDMTGEYDEDDNPVDSYDQVTITAKLEYATGAYPTIGNTDIIANRYGTATMELYRFQVNSSGQMGDIVDRRHIYMPGVAEKARVMDGNGVVNNRVLNNLVFPDKDMVRHTDHAYYADRATSLGTTGTSVNRNKIDDNLYLTNRDAYLVTTKTFELRSTSTETWSSNSTHTVSINTSGMNGWVIHAEVTGSGINAGGKFLLTSGLGNGSGMNFKLMSYQSEDNNASQSTSIIEITVSGSSVTIKETGGRRSISGSLYLIVFMVGTK